MCFAQWQLMSAAVSTVWLFLTDILDSVCYMPDPVRNSTRSCFISWLIVLCKGGGPVPLSRFADCLVRELRCWQWQDELCCCVYTCYFDPSQVAGTQPGSATKV